MALDDLVPLIKNPPIEYRPELRWWLAEGLHTDETLRYEIDTEHRLGFGGMEFLAMDEGDIDHSRYGWGAEEWVHDSQIVVEETTRRNMSVSGTSGTNWSNANLPPSTPTTPPPPRSWILRSRTWRRVRSGPGRCPGSTWKPSRPPTAQVLPGHRGVIRDQLLVAVVAVRVLKETDTGAILDVDSVLDLTDQVRHKTLKWTAPDGGPWRLFTYWMHGTGQTASPSASVNYVDPDGVQAVVDYWDATVLTPELREQLAANPRAQMYMDSLELTTYGAGGLFWGRTVVEEFRTRRGYDIIGWLPFLTRDVAFMACSTVYHNEPEDQHRITVEKVRFDYVPDILSEVAGGATQMQTTEVHPYGLLGPVRLVRAAH